MKIELKYINCGEKLIKSFKCEIDEILKVIKAIKWTKEFSITHNGKKLEHQTAYNKEFEIQFKKLGWSIQPTLSENPRLVGDFAKGLVFGEVQFGNSSTLYRDFYKFQYATQNGLSSINVLIVPVKAKKFFPTRPDSVGNMAEYGTALRYFKTLPISVPTLVIGLIDN